VFFSTILSIDFYISHKSLYLIKDTVKKIPSDASFLQHAYHGSPVFNFLLLIPFLHSSTSDLFPRSPIFSPLTTIARWLDGEG